MGLILMPAMLLAFVREVHMEDRLATDKSVHIRPGEVVGHAVGRGKAKEAKAEKMRHALMSGDGHGQGYRERAGRRDQARVGHGGGDVVRK